MAPPPEHRGTGPASGLLLLLLLLAAAAAPAAVSARRASKVPIPADAGLRVTPDDDKVLDAIDVAFEKALNASNGAAPAEKFPLFEATLAKSLVELDDHKFVPRVQNASKVASEAVAAAASTPDEKFAVYFAKLTQVLVGTVDAEKKAWAEKKELAAEKEEATAEKKIVAADEKEVAADNKEAAADKEIVAAEKKEAAAGKEVAAEKEVVAAPAAEKEVADKKDSTPAAEKKEGAADKEVAAEKEASTKKE